MQFIVKFKYYNANPKAFLFDLDYNGNDKSIILCRIFNSYWPDLQDKEIKSITLINYQSGEVQLFDFSKLIYSRIKSYYSCCKDRFESKENITLRNGVNSY